MQRIVHVRTGEPGAGAEIDDWIRRQPARAEAFDDALDACLHVARSRDRPPLLVWVGADWLSPHEDDLLHYIALGWPGTPTVLYGARPVRSSERAGAVRARDRDELRALLAMDLDSLVAHVRLVAAPPGDPGSSRSGSRHPSIREIECPSAHPPEPAGAGSFFWLGAAAASERDNAREGPAHSGDLATEARPDVRVSAAGCGCGPAQGSAPDDSSSLRRRAMLTPEELEALLGDSTG